MKIKERDVNNNRIKRIGEQNCRNLKIIKTFMPTKLS